MRFRRLLIALALVSLVTPIAFAQTTGSVSGEVRSPDGAALPGAAVTISGPQMPLGRTMTTLDDGRFQFSGIIPGEYTLRAELGDLGFYERTVIVALNKETQVNATLQPRATAAVEVSAAAPLVDTRSTDVSKVTTKEQINKLPLARTFTGMFQLAPGVVTTGIAINPTNVGVNAGGGRQDNTFLYDGVNVTNPFFGDAYQDFAELDIQEVNITRGGITAEFGRTGGFMVNGVTRSGSNNFHGDLRLEYQPSGLQAESEDTTLTSEFERFRPGVGFGGRIIEDHLFFYGSANLYRQTESARVNRTGDLPDSVFEQDEFFGKLTLTPFSSVLVDGSYRWRDSEISNDGISSLEFGTVASNSKTRDRVGVISGLWTVTPRFTIEAKYNHNENRNTGEPVVGIDYRPPFNTANPAAVGRYDDGVFVSGAEAEVGVQDFFRDEYRLSAGFLFNAMGGTHDLRGGFSFSNNKEELSRTANGWGNITRQTSAAVCGAAGAPCFRAVYRLAGPAQVSDGETWGIFLQDRITWDRLTLNLGVLANQDEFIPNEGRGFDILRGDFTVPVANATIPTCAAAPDAPACTYKGNKTFEFEDQIQPRLGVAFVLDKNVGDKLYANFGRYSNMDNQSFARAAAPIRLVQSTAIINATTGAVVSDAVQANQTNKRVLENIDPTHTDEVLGGYARPLGGGWVAELWGMYRKTEDIIEDFPRFNQFVLRTDGTCCLGVGGFGYGNVPGYRKYRAATVEVKKAFRDNWSVDVSYTLSRLEGNWDLDYGTQLFYSSSYIDDGPFLYVTEPNRDGILIGDRTHIGKIFANYVLPTNTTLGGYLRYQSGRPWEVRGRDPLYNTTFVYYEEAGSRRTESWTNFDFLVSQELRLGPGEVRLAVTVLNLFDSQPELAVDSSFCQTRPCNPVDTPNFNDIPASNRNANFGNATLYAPPRRIVLSAGYSF
ncbi:MAG TPA: carboxypeptidase regulatory-like domain-containing protein [Thermoanaerobaculia bacterium]|nr:carboxypeptidase regulatory-like domain-containing protein [Thermoanaerobaculia bacterium]